MLRYDTISSCAFKGKIHEKEVKNEFSPMICSGKEGGNSKINKQGGPNKGVESGKISWNK